MASPSRPPLCSWCVYFVRARGRVLYAGIAKDVEQRLELHRSGRGAKFLRGRGPLQLVYSRKLGEQGLALRVEQRLKRLPKAEKEALVRAAPTRARLLRLLDLEFIGRLPSHPPRTAGTSRRPRVSTALAGARAASREGS